jgi:hypothetical protein
VVHFINTMPFKMAPEIPPYLPLLKGGEQNPPFIERETRGDFSEEVLSILSLEIRRRIYEIPY